LEPGLYQSQSEILRVGLRLLKERKDLKQSQLATLRRQINEGAAEADRGELVKASAVFAQLRKKSAVRRHTKA
jgi:antitoxin ParD1/3/4